MAQIVTNAGKVRACTSQSSSYRCKTSAYTSKIAAYTCKIAAYTCKSATYTCKIATYTCKIAAYTCKIAAYTCKSAAYTCKIAAYTCKPLACSGENAKFPAKIANFLEISSNDGPRAVDALTKDVSGMLKCRRKDSAGKVASILSLPLRLWEEPLLPRAKAYRYSKRAFHSPAPGNSVAVLRPTNARIRTLAIWSGWPG